MVNDSFFQPPRHAQGQQGEERQGGIGAPGVGEGNAVERLVHVEEVIVAHGEEVGTPVHQLRHGGGGVGEAADGEREHPPQGAGAEDDAALPRHAGDEDGKALGREHEEHHGEEYGSESAVHGEALVAVEEGEVKQSRGAEGDGLGEEFAEEGGADGTAGEGKPFARRAPLLLVGDAECRGEHGEHEDERGHEDVGKVNGVTDPGVVEGVGLERHGHEFRLELRTALAFRQEEGLLHGAVHEGGLEAHILVGEGTGEEVGVVGVERQDRHLAGGHLRLESFGDMEDAVHARLLQCLARLGKEGGAQGDVRLGDGVQGTHQLSRHGRVVLIHDGDGQVHGQPLFEEVCEKEETEGGREEYHEEIYPAGSEPAQLPPHDRP